MTFRWKHPVRVRSTTSEVRAVVALPEPMQTVGRRPHTLTWAGGIRLLGAGVIVIPGRTLDDPDEARAHAAAVLAAAERMEAMRSRCDSGGVAARIRARRSWLSGVPAEVAAPAK